MQTSKNTVAKTDFPNMFNQWWVLYCWICVYTLFPFLKWAHANPVADPDQSPGAACCYLTE